MSIWENDILLDTYMYCLIFSPFIQMPYFRDVSVLLELAHFIRRLVHIFIQSLFKYCSSDEFMIGEDTWIGS